MLRNSIIKSALVVSSVFVSFTAQAQAVFPLFHFHENASQQSTSAYRDNFFSGFMQSMGTENLNGFLQMPFIGRPILVYVGEKDSTQYMAYASSYNNLNKTEEHTAQSDLNFFLNRYGIKANVKVHGSLAEQTYVFPDTVAEKGFLIDIDHALNDLDEENMSVRFVDHQTICAFKKRKSATEPTLYYYARFSKCFDSYNIRRESVTLKNGNRESRLKAVFTFDLQKDEPLKVVSAVSSASADAAYAAVEGHMPKSALTGPLVASAPKRSAASKTVAQSSPSVSERQKKTTLSASSQTTSRSASKPQTTKTASADSRKTTGRSSSASDSRMSDKLVVETRDAALRTSFYVALERVMQVPAFRKIKGVSEFVEKLSSEMLPEADTLAVHADSLIKHYVAGSMSGASTAEDTDGKQAMRFIVCAMGLYPQKVQGAEDKMEYRLEHPSFNVVTLYFNDNRRFILHVKNASALPTAIKSVTFNGEKLVQPFVVDQKHLLRGGVMAVKM